METEREKKRGERERRNGEREEKWRERINEERERRNGERKEKCRERERNNGPVRIMSGLCAAQREREWRFCHHDPYLNKGGDISQLERKEGGRTMPITLQGEAEKMEKSVMKKYSKICSYRKLFKQNSRLKTDKKVQSHNRTGHVLI